MNEFIGLASLAFRSIYNRIRNKDSIKISECVRTLDTEIDRTLTALSKYRTALLQETTKRLDPSQVPEIRKFPYLPYQMPHSSKFYIKSGVFTVGNHNKSYNLIKNYHFIDFLDKESLTSKDKLSRGYIVESEDELIIAIRGTSTLDDWLTDLNVLPLSALFGSKKLNELDSLGLVIHSGFLKASLWIISRLQEILPLIKNRQKEKRLVLTGHSLGGAIALVSGWIALNIQLTEMPIDIFAFGAPSVDTNKKIVEHPKLNEFRIIRPGDAVAGIGLKMINEEDDTSPRYILSDSGEIFYFDNSAPARAILLFEFIKLASRMLKDKLTHWPTQEEQKKLSNTEIKNLSETLRLIKSDFLGLSNTLEIIRLSLRSNENAFNLPHPIRLLQVNTSLNQQDFFILEHPMERYLEDLDPV